MENKAKRSLLISQMENKLKPFIIAGGIAIPAIGLAKPTSEQEAKIVYNWRQVPLDWTPGMMIY